MRRAAWIAVALGLGFLAVFPLVAPTFEVDLLSKILILALFAASLNLLIGYTGLASLGHAAFFGVASYAAGLLALHAQAPWWAALPGGIVAAGVTGAGFGLLALRTSGSYFLMITLALAQVVWGIAVGWRSMTGGDDGLSNVPRPVIMPGAALDGATAFYYFAVLWIVIAAVLLWLVIRSPFGHALQGIRENEARMAALGYDVWRYKYVAFVVAALFAGVAGALFVYFNRFVGPDSLTLGRSADALLMVIVGGVGTFFGPLIGATALIVLETTIGSFTQRWVTVLGLIYIAVALFVPGGVTGFLRALHSHGPRA